MPTEPLLGMSPKSFNWRRVMVGIVRLNRNIYPWTYKHCFHKMQMLDKGFISEQHFGQIFNCPVMMNLANINRLSSVAHVRKVFLQACTTVGQNHPGSVVILS